MARKSQVVIVNGEEYPAELVEQARRVAQKVGCDLDVAIRSVIKARKIRETAQPADPDTPARIYLGFGNLLRGR